MIESVDYYYNIALRRCSQAEETVKTTLKGDALTTECCEAHKPISQRFGVVLNQPENASPSSRERNHMTCWGLWHRRCSVPIIISMPAAPTHNNFKLHLHTTLHPHIQAHRTGWPLRVCRMWGSRDVASIDVVIVSSFLLAVWLPVTEQQSLATLQLC